MAGIFYVVIGLLVVVGSVVGKQNKIPSYIEVCKRNDPHVEDCILNAVERLRPQLVKGIPELDVPALDPLLIRELPVKFGNSQTTGFSAVGHNVYVHGASNFKINKLSVNLKEHTFTVGLDIPELYFSADYDINLRIAMLPVKGRGPIHSNATNIKGDVTLFGKLVDRDGGQYYHFDSTEVDLRIGDFRVKIENLFRGDTILTEASNAAINANSQEFLQSILPIVERTVGSVIIDIANKITKNITYDELFPAE